MKRIRVSAAIIIQEGKVYATRRGKGEWAGFWEFPGGKQEEGENGEEAAVREIREELGIIICIDSHFCTVEYQYPGFFLLMDCYLSHIKEGHPALTEHSEARWLSFDELEGVEWLPPDRIVAERLRKAL